jgi:hypothetical protein
VIAVKVLFRRIFPKPTLVADETVLYRHGANFIASLTEADLTRFFADQLMWTIGMSGKEAIGGHLYITKYRIIFVAHGMNRLKGQFSIPLTQVVAMRRVVELPVLRFVVETGAGRYDFVSWHIREAMRIIDANRGNRSEAVQAEMVETLEKNLPLCFLNAMFVLNDMAETHD